MRIEKNAVDLVYMLIEAGREYELSIERLHAVAPNGFNMCCDMVETRKASAYTDYVKRCETIDILSDIFRVDPYVMWKMHGAEYDEMTESVTEDQARRWLRECKL